MDFDHVYQLYFSDVFAYLRSLSADQNIAEELTQETFFRALRAIDHFDGRKDIRAWLFTIAKHIYIDHCRKEQHRAGEPPDEALPAPGPSFTEILTDRDTAYRVHQFLHQMKEPYKEVFSLRIFGELSFEQIANLFGKSPGWARVTYYRAKQQLIDEMEGS